MLIADQQPGTAPQTTPSMTGHGPPLALLACHRKRAPIVAGDAVDKLGLPIARNRDQAAATRSEDAMKDVAVEREQPAPRLTRARSVAM